MIFISTTKTGERIEYRDSKRWLWVLSVLSPSLPGLAALTFLRLLVPGHRWELKDPPEWDPQESGEAGGPTSDLEVERFVHVATVDPEQAARTRDRAIQGP